MKEAISINKSLSALGDVISGNPPLTTLKKNTAMSAYAIQS